MAASDPLNKPSPFLENRNIVRQRRRPRHAEARNDIKHPLLLYANLPILRKLIEDAHETEYPEGTEFVRSTLQQKCWMVGLRNAFGNEKLKCVKCRKQKIGGFQPFMADLPKERLAERPFPSSNTGVYHLRPFQVRFMGKSLERWYCLLTGLTAGDLHVDIVPSLEVDASLAAITRIMARRWKTDTILGVYGTNFVGAAREIGEWRKAWNQSDNEHSLAQKQTKWKFSPSGAPHFGDVWLRMVRSCKKAMLAIVEKIILTADELSTTTCSVEQILNSRHLSVSLMILRIWMLWLQDFFYWNEWAWQLHSYRTVSVTRISEEYSQCRKLMQMWYGVDGTRNNSSNGMRDLNVAKKESDNLKSDI